MQEILSIPKIDCHMHVNGASRTWGWDDNDRIIECGERLGIEVFCCSIPVTRGIPTMEEVRSCNDAVLAAMRRYPGKILGYCFVVPGYREALDEIDRCLDAGMIGIKLYNQYPINEPPVFPIVEKAIAEGVPILSHAGYLPNPADLAQQPRISHAAHFVDLARRYPEAILIHGHIAGGGDWEWTIKTLAEAPNVYLDTSGSVPDEGIIEYAVQHLGAGRLLFATDMTMEGSVGRLAGAQISLADKKRICYDNMADILKRRQR